MSTLISNTSQGMPTNKELYILPQLNNLTQATLESYLYASDVAGETLQSSNSPSQEVIAQRLMRFLKANKEQVNQEQVKLVSKVAQKALLTGNTDRSNDFEKLVKQISKLRAKLDGDDLRTKSDLAMIVKSKKKLSFESIFTSPTVWKIGAVFTAVVVMSIGYAMLGAKQELSVCTKMISQKDELFRAIQNKESTFKCATPDLQAALFASTTDYNVVKEFPEDLRDDLEIMLPAIKANACNFKHAGKGVTANKNALLAALEGSTFECHDVIAHASKDLQDDEEAVSLAIKKFPMALEWASDRIKDNTDIVLSAMKHHRKIFPSAVRWASARIRDDEEIMQWAINNSAETLQYASDRIKDNMDLLSPIIKKYPYVLKWVSYRIKDNDEIVRRAITDYPYAFQYASERLQRDSEMIKKV